MFRVFKQLFGERKDEKSFLSAWFVIGFTFHPLFFTLYLLPFGFL